MESLENLSFCVFDLETTGGNQQKDKIIEIGLVRIENLKITQELTYLVNPGIPIPEFIQRLTSIKQKDLEGRPPIEEVIDEIIRFMGDSILVAHNSSFDVPFFNSVLKRLGKKKLPNKVICTNLMTKYLIPEILNSNLPYMSKIFEIRKHKAHRALEDARATANLFLIYLDSFINKRIKKINHLYYPRNKFELDSLHVDREYTPEEIVERISKVRTPCTVTIKGKQGLILACLPIDNIAEDREFVLSYLKELEWETVSTKMYGSFFRVLLHFNNHYCKFGQDIQRKVLSYLYQKHLGRDLPAEQEIIHEEELTFMENDFMVARHLIPEQYVVYSFLNLSSSNEMIFRYPTHNKKLIQYLTAQIRRHEATKKQVRQSCLNKTLMPLFNDYLKRVQAEKSNYYLFFKKEDIIQHSQIFLERLKSFHDQIENPYHFPLEHL